VNAKIDASAFRRPSDALLYHPRVLPSVIIPGPLRRVPRPLKQVYANRAMTLCIALKATDWNAGTEPLPPALVLCTDSLGSTDFSSTETISKTEMLPHGFVALLAGPISTARELVEILREQMGAGLVGTVHLIEQIRRCLTIYKHRFAEAHIGARLGMSYREFREQGEQGLPADLYRQTAWEVRDHYLGVALIVAGFATEPQYGGREAVIIKLDTDDRVSVCDAFAAIGSGALLAEANLMQRDYLSMAPVELATYIAYESKRLGERAPGVGKQTGIMAILDRPGGAIVDAFMADNLPLLDREFKRFGPQPLTVRKLRPLPTDVWFRVIGPSP